MCNRELGTVRSYEAASYGPRIREEELNMERRTPDTRCYGKKAPKTFDALYLFGRYHDPREVQEKLKGLLSASAIVGSILLPILIHF